MHTTTNMPTAVYCYMALIKIRNILVKMLKNKKKHKAHMHYCWQHYVTHPPCLQVLSISDFWFKYQKKKKKKKKCWYNEIVKFHEVCQRKCLKIHNLKHISQLEETADIGNTLYRKSIIKIAFLI